MSDRSGDGAQTVPTADAAAPSRRAAALRFAVAVLVPGAIAVLLATTLNRRRPLSVSTDIVGFPIHAAYNIYELFWRYRLAVVFFPLAAVLLHHVLGRAWPRSRWPASGSPEAPPAREAMGAALVAQQIARSVAVGATFGIGLSLLDGGGPTRFLRDVTLSALAYAAVQLGAAAFTTRGRRSGTAFAAAAGRLNAVVAPLTLASLYAASRATQVAVAGTPAHAYPWLPGSWVAAAATALALLQLWRLRGARAPEGVRRIEAEGILFVTAPVVVFLYTAQLPGALGALDVFHDGEALSSGWAVRAGAFPWRDSIFIHGLLQDVLPTLAGFAAFGDTAWGGLAGFPMFAHPLFWVLNGLLFAYLFRESPFLLAAALTGVLLGAYAAPHARLAPLALVLLALAALLERATWVRAVLLAVVLVGANVLAPELAYAVPACGAVLLAADASRWERGRPLARNLDRSLRAGVAGAGVLALWFAFLAYHGAAGAFLHYYVTFVPGHELTGGIPIAGAIRRDPALVAYMLLPPVTVLLALWYVVARVRGRRALSVRDWVVIALAIFTFSYYGKFLSRADMHLMQSVSPALLLAWYAVDKLARLAGAAVRARWVTAGAGLVVLAAVVASAPGDLLAQLSRPATSFAPAASGAPVHEALGWSGETLRERSEAWREVGAFLDAILEPGEPLFDFTNQPGLYHYLLRRPPATRYAHVSMAIRRHTQLDLLDELARTRPRLVVFDSPDGLPSWDGVPNAVRHYEIARTLLLEYRPFARVAGQIFFARRDAALAAHAPLPSGAEFIDDRDFLAAAPACAWGYAPLFLRPDGLSPGPELEVLSPRMIQRVTASGWAVEETSRQGASAVVVVAGDRVVGRVTPTLPRRDVAMHLHAEQAERSGFALTAEWAGAPVHRDQLRAYGVTSDGRASALDMRWQPVGPAPGRLDIEGRAVAVVPGAARGHVDDATAQTVAVTPVALPDDVTGVAGLELVLDAAAQDGVALFASGTGASPIATFRVRAATSSVLRLRLDSCAAWHAPQGRELFLKHDASLRVRSVRLLRRTPAIEAAGG